MLLLSQEINNQNSRIFVIAGPCVIESEKLIFEMAVCLSLRPSAGGSAIFNIELLWLNV